MSSNHTLEQLTAASNEELAKIAAEEVMGWKLDSSFRAYFACWHPATDRNQSGMLLEQVTRQHQNLRFSVWVGAEGSVSFYREGLVVQTESVPGNDARAETIAAILAAQAA